MKMQMNEWRKDTIMEAGMVKMHMNALMRNTHEGMNDEGTYEWMTERQVHGGMTIEDAHECMIEGHEHGDMTEKMHMHAWLKDTSL